MGAGPIARLSDADAPPGARLYFDTTASESPERTAERIGDVLRLHPPIVVWGFDFAEAEPDRALLAEMARRSRSAATVTVMLGPGGPGDRWDEDVAATVDWWKAGICRSLDRIVCVDLSTYRDAPDAVSPAVASAIADGLVLLESERATTQVRR